MVIFPSTGEVVTVTSSPEGGGGNWVWISPGRRKNTRQVVRSQIHFRDTSCRAHISQCPQLKRSVRASTNHGRRKLGAASPRAQHSPHQSQSKSTADYLGIADTSTRIKSISSGFNTSAGWAEEEFRNEWNFRPSAQCCWL